MQNARPGTIPFLPLEDEPLPVVGGPDPIARLPAGSHLKPHSMLRLGQALKTTIGREFRIGHMKDYHNYA
eukprot:SAG22_NODE_10868_length_512_cov_2.184019_2_plen_69_part_01